MDCGMLLLCDLLVHYDIYFYDDILYELLDVRLLKEIRPSYGRETRLTYLNM